MKPLFREPIGVQALIPAPPRLLLAEKYSGLPFSA
jgi:hypothetical protein